MSKVTLVSTLPFKLTEHKPGLNPSYYEVPAAEYNDISTIVIEDGFHLLLIPLTDSKVPPMRITDTAEQIAASLIRDYVSAKLAIDLETGAIPGLFWVEGKMSTLEIKQRFPHKVEVALHQTTLWFENLVKLADDDWAKSKQHRSISGEQRDACNFLNLEREWNFSAQAELNNLCFACKSVVHPEAIICSVCKAILNQVAYDKKKSQFVGA